MTKFKKQMITVIVLAVVGVALGVGYLLFDKGETALNPAPVIAGALDGETLTVSGLDPEKSYVYSLDGKSYIEIAEGSTEFSVQSGKMCYVKEKDDKSEVAIIGGFGEPTKDGRPYLFEPVEKSELNSIFVHNTLDEYTQVHKASGAFKIEGLEGYEVSEEMMVYLRAYTLDVLALRYVDAEDDLSTYGINLDDPAVYFVVTYNETESHKVIIGDKTPDGDGYYAMLEGRDALYVIPTGIELCVLKSRHAYVTPALVRSVEDKYKYTLKSFTLNKNGEKFITVDAVSGSLTYGNNSTHRLTYPAYNYATNLTNFDIFLSAIKSLQGSETLLYGDAVNEENLREYGFFDENGKDISDYSFTYSYPAFSEELYVVTAEEGFTVYSKNSAIVASVPAESLAFLDWDMLLWVSSEIYLLDIEDIESITFSSGGRMAEFVLSGEAAELKVHANGKLANIDEFKELYRSILYVLVTSYSEQIKYDNEQLRMTIVTENGETLEYAFYAHSAQNSFYTLNGFGEFFVSAEKINEIKEKAFELLY